MCTYGRFGNSAKADRGTTRVRSKLALQEGLEEYREVSEMMPEFGCTEDIDHCRCSWCLDLAYGDLGA